MYEGIVITINIVNTSCKERRNVFLTSDHLSQDNTECLYGGQDRLGLTKKVIRVE